MSILTRIKSQGGEVIRTEWRFRLQPGRLTPDALAWLRARWWQVCAEAWPVWGEWAERAAILEYDAGLSRAEAERRAYAEVCQC